MTAATRAVVTVEVTPPYDVVVGAGVLAEAAARAETYDRVLVLADARVLEPHGRRLGSLADAPHVAFEGGEGAKTFVRLESVLDACAAAGCSRRSCLVAFGGGSIGDLGGLAAALFKRGMDVVQLPTTLLAQVDASVGGKTAINLTAGKNLAGSFHQPAAVLADTEVLATLPDAELRSGLGEVVKTALIGGETDLARLEERAARIALRDAEMLAETVADCVRIKARVVAEDPEEKGARRALNLGHTFGHAIEHAAGYGRVPHGEAVAVGLLLALEASRNAGLLRDARLPERVRALHERLGLSTGLDALRDRLGTGTALDPDDLMKGLVHDKKGAVGAPEFVLLHGAGALVLGHRLDEELVRSLFD